MVLDSLGDLVPARADDPPVDYAHLAGLLTTLGSPVRLELLKLLRFSHTLGEIRVRPYRASGEHNPDRIVSRQTVQGHLDKLMEAGLVVATPVERAGRTVPSYRVSSTRVYALMEDLRSLSTLYATRGAGADVTGTVAGAVEAEEMTGPRLILVHGVYEGKAFPLTKETRDGEGWTIGREAHLPVALDYDPYVSVENARIVQVRRRFHVEDLASKNGTLVNWRRLPSGGTRALAAGDIVGVGRSLLAFIPG